MLTHQDKTVLDALDLFQRTKDYPIRHWGFKGCGIITTRNAAHNNSDERCREGHLSGGSEFIGGWGLRGARLAVDLGFDILMGTVFYPSIGDYLKDNLYIIIRFQDMSIAIPASWTER